MGKQWYKKRVVWVVGVIVVLFTVLLSFTNGKEGSKKIGKYEIPNVFGVYYEDATDVLEAEGFEVKTIETSVNSISDKLLYPLENVEAGTVFKIDDYILDGSGNFTINYEIDRDLESMTSKDKSIVLYYAKETYLGEDSTNSNNSSINENVEETSTKATTTEDEKTNTDTATKEVEKEETNSGGIRADFKAAMDSYEKFFDEYVAIMKKYKNNPSDMSILADYSKYMGQYAQTMKDFEKWESEDMNTAEAAYYLDVQNRITNKLLEVAQ